VDDFEWVVGVFDGAVESYEVVDLTANAWVTDRVELGLNVSNLFDDEHWEAFGGDLLGRRALASVEPGWLGPFPGRRGSFAPASGPEALLVEETGQLRFAR